MSAGRRGRQRRAGRPTCSAGRPFWVLSRVEEGVEKAEAVLRAITLEEGKRKAEQEAEDG